MEAEYMALTHTTRHGIWLRTLFTELGLTLRMPTLIVSDNQAAINHASDAMTTARSKHIDIRHHFIRDNIATGHVTLNYCDTADNLADLLTKALPAPAHWKLMGGLGLNRS